MSITLKDIRKSFGADAAVAGVSLDIAPGEFFVVLGPSGCGKSTLLRLIAGLETLDAGEVAIAGRPVAGPGLNLAPEDRRVGVVFQSYALWPHMSVAENVAFPIRTEGVDRTTRERRTEACLATVELLPYADRRPAELSGGQRQRVALARCLAQRADTILMDEPLANLDPHLRHAMEEELARFHASSDATTLYITHDQREAMALADRVAIMWQGRILQAASPETVYRQPADERVARFIGRSAIVDATVTAVSGGRAHVEIAGRTLEIPAATGTVEGPARLMVRPDDAVAAPADDGMAATVERATYRGGFWETHAAVEGLGEPLILNLPDKAAPGERIHVRIANAWLLPAAGAEGRLAA
ncbi:ABC transporter ATP-binding protein [Amorphus sp. MBR-141]